MNTMEIVEEISYSNEIVVE